MKILPWAELSVDEINEIEAAKQRYTDDWSVSATPAMVFFLASLDSHLRGRGLVELVKRDMQLSWRSAKPALTERYLESWVELNDDAVIEELLEAECLARATYAKTPRPTELELRFPDHHYAIDLPSLETFAAEQRARECFDRDGRFFVIRKLGAGGMGVVYEVLDRERHRRVALKTVYSGDPEALYRLKREFRTVSEAVHPNLVQLYEAISDGDHWFFTMEIVDGHDLVRSLSPLSDSIIEGSIHETHTALPRNPVADEHTLSSAGFALDNSLALSAESAIQVASALPWNQALLGEVRNALVQLATGVAALHERKILHRDLKPSNVLYTSDGRVVILDFGLAAEFRALQTKQGESPQTGTIANTTGVAGTAHYMSPEQAAGEPLTQASDWYSVGVIMYQLLTGIRPFAGNPLEVMAVKQRRDPPAPAELNSMIPEDLSRLCMDLMQREPSARPGAEEVARRLGGGDDASTRMPDPDQLFVGRSRELDLLAQAYRQAAKGGSVVAVVKGSSGSGKSTLVQRFLESLSTSHGPLILRGRCYEQESVPYKAIDSLIDSLAQWLMHHPDARDELNPSDFEYLTRIFPVLERVRFMPVASSDDDVPDARELRRLAIEALGRLLTSIGEWHRLVLVIDDLQWGDLDSALLLNELFARAQPRLLLIVSLRSEYEATSACLKAMTFLNPDRWDARRRYDITLGPLSTNETRELALQLLSPTAARRETLAGKVAREAEGNPYFVWELARFLSESTDAEGTTPRRGATRLEEVLWARIERLPATTRRLLEVVSIAGQPIALGHASEAGAITDDPQADWANLRSQHLIKGFGPRLDSVIETYHDRIRETVVAHLPPDVQRRHHAGLAQVLAADESSDPETIAVHFEGCGEYVKAGEYLARAATVAAESLAFSRAVELFQRSLDLRPLQGEAGCQIRVQLAEALANAGFGHRAAQVFRAAADATDDPQATGLLRSAAMQCCISGHIDEGRELFRRVLRQKGMRLFTRPWKAAVSLAWWRARLNWRGLESKDPGDNADPRLLDHVDTLWAVTAGLSMVDVLGIAALQSRGLLLALEAGEPYRVSRALSLEATMISLRSFQSLAKAKEMQHRADRLACEMNHPHALGLARFSAGMIHFFQNEWPAALEQFEQAEAILSQRCIGVWWERAMVRTMLVWSLYHMGEVERLRGYHDQYIADAEQRSDRFASVNVQAIVTPFLALVQDDTQAAHECIEEALRQWPYHGYHTQHMLVLYSRVHLRLYQGTPEAAWDLLSREWRQLRSSLQLFNHLTRTMLIELRARVALACAADPSRRQQMLKHARRDAERLQRENTPLARALTNRTLASLALAREDRAECLARLQTTVDGFDELHMKLHAAPARRCLGKIIGGEAGDLLVDQATETMRSEKIQNMRAWTRMFISGFEN